MTSRHPDYVRAARRELARDLLKWDKYRREWAGEADATIWLTLASITATHRHEAAFFAWSIRWLTS